MRKAFAEVFLQYLQGNYTQVKGESHFCFKITSWQKYLRECEVNRFTGSGLKINLSSSAAHGFQCWNLEPLGPMVALKKAEDNIVVSLCKQFAKIHCSKPRELQRSWGASTSCVLQLTWQSCLSKSPGLPARWALEEVASRQENWLKMILFHFLTTINNKK